MYSFNPTVTDKFTESMYVLANEPSVALYRLQEHVRRSLPELVQHKVLAYLIFRVVLMTSQRLGCVFINAYDLLLNSVFFRFSSNAQCPHCGTNKVTDSPKTAQSVA